MSDPNTPQPPTPGYFPDPTLEPQPTTMDPVDPFQSAAPSYGAPAYQPPTYEAPTYQPPTFQQSGYEQPGYQPQASAPPAYSPGAAQVPPPSPPPSPPSYGTTGALPAGGQPSYQQPYSTPGYQQPSYQQPSPPYQPGFPAPGYGYQQPPKKSRAGVMVAVIAAVVVVMAGVAVGGLVLANKSSDRTTTSTNHSGPTIDNSSVAPDPNGPKDHTGDLRDFLLKPPKSSKPLDDPMSKTGTMTLEDDVAQSSDKTARRSFLEDYNFVIEAVVEWHQADDTIVEIRLLRFDTEADAKGYFAEDKDSFTDDYGVETMTPVAGAPDAVTYADNKEDKYGYVSTASIGRKGDVVMVIFTSQAPPLSVSVADTLVKKEYDKL